MGEFNIYGEMLDFQCFIKLFMDTGVRVEFDKNDFFVEWVTVVLLLDILKKEHFVTFVMVLTEKNIFCHMRLKMISLEIIHRLKINIIQF
jgi:hypothetical protein